jgi:hypothetical protein
MARGQRGGLWLLNGGQVASVVVVVVLKQPLAAGAMGLLCFGTLALETTSALQTSSRLRDDLAGSRVGERVAPWLMAMMLVAALAIP